jgi:hypothetical protein
MPHLPLVNTDGGHHNRQKHGKEFEMQASFAQIVHRVVFSEALPEFLQTLLKIAFSLMCGHLPQPQSNQNYR